MRTTIGRAYLRNVESKLGCPVAYVQFTILKKSKLRAVAFDHSHQVCGVLWKGKPWSKPGA